jgi:hypothetical protein
MFSASGKRPWEEKLFEDFVKDSATASYYLMEPKLLPASTSVPG